jgi:hypothetical protein
LREYYILGIMKYYVQDTTIGGKYVYFDNIRDLVNYLGNTLIPRATGGSRAAFIQNIIDLGHGYDDVDGVTLTRVISETFNVGIVRGNTHVRTDVHATARFANENYGD